MKMAHGGINRKRNIPLTKAARKSTIKTSVSINADPFRPSTDWNEQTKAEEWRAAWKDHVNSFFELNNHAARIDHRSYERQGIDQIPTIHLGVAASQMDRRGIRTERGEVNREIEVSNRLLRQLKARIVKLQNWLDDEMANTEPPSLADVIQGILSRQAQPGKSSRSQTIYNLKDAAHMLNYLVSNKIMDITDLDKKFESMINKQFSIHDKLKPIDRRLKTLGEHIKQAGYYREYSKIYKMYNVKNSYGASAISVSMQC